MEGSLKGSTCVVLALLDHLYLYFRYCPERCRWVSWFCPPFNPFSFSSCCCLVLSLPIDFFIVFLLRHLQCIELFHSFYSTGFLSWPFPQVYSPLDVTSSIWYDTISLFLLFVLCFMLVPISSEDRWMPVPCKYRALARFCRSHWKRGKFYVFLIWMGVERFLTGMKIVGVFLLFCLFVALQTHDWCAVKVVAISGAREERQRGGVSLYRASSFVVLGWCTRGIRLRKINLHIFVNRIYSIKEFIPVLILMKIISIVTR